MTTGPGGWAWNADAREGLRGVLVYYCPPPPRVVTASAPEAPSGIPDAG